MKIRSKILMLPTNEPSIIQMHIQNKDFQPVCDYDAPYMNPPAIFQNHHLFFITDEKILENDVYLHQDVETSEWSLNIAPRDLWEVNNEFDLRYKVISSTDKSLNLPMPSYHFVQWYLKKPFDETFIEIYQGDHFTNTELGFLNMKGKPMTNEENFIHTFEVDTKEPDVNDSIKMWYKFAPHVKDRNIELIVEYFRQLHCVKEVKYDPKTDQSWRIFNRTIYIEFHEHQTGTSIINLGAEIGRREVC